MRTKALLAVAAVLAAGVATSMAEVYSVNAVGYVNTKVPAGVGKYAIIANPLNNGGNTLAEIMPTLPENTSIFLNRAGKFINAIYAQDDDGNLNWGDGATLVVNPGEGFFIQNPGASEMTITFVGEVPQGTGANALVNTIPAGYSLKSSIVPQAGALDVLGYPTGDGSDGDTIYLLGADQKYASSTYGRNDDDVFVWEPATPVGVGQGFWLNAKPKTWTREFDVNNP